MTSVRRWYIYLVCVVSLQAVTWAIIALMRNLFSRSAGSNIELIAFQSAVIIIGLPLFLVHWAWAQRLAAQELEERQSGVRHLYFYATLGAFLGPFIANAFGFVSALLRRVFAVPDPTRTILVLSPAESVVYTAVAMGVLALFWFYHHRRLSDLDTAAAAGEYATTFRRLYLYLFSGVGLTMTALAVAGILRWLIDALSRSETIGGTGGVMLASEVARIVVGLPVWYAFWRLAQRRFALPDAGERDSAVRKFYLYLVVLVAVLTTVTNATVLLAGGLRRLLDLPSLGDAGIALPVLVVMAGVWAYHAFILRLDAAVAVEAPRQAALRRIYLYLVAGVGLAALLVGIGGDLTVIIRSLSGDAFGDVLRELVAWFTAATIAGLPVWLIPWRRAQSYAVAETATGADERRSLVRKIFLYFYLFIATMAVLGGAVYIVFRLLSLALGEPGEGHLARDLGQAAAYTLIGVGIWLYHGAALRGDGRRSRLEEARRIGDLPVAIVDVGEGAFGRAVAEGLKRELPELLLDAINLGAPEPDVEESRESILARLARAKLIIGPWFIAVAGAADGLITSEIAAAIAANPAPKLLAPVASAGWEWAGVERQSGEALVDQTMKAVRQLLGGEEVRSSRPLGAAAMIGIIIAAFLVLSLVVRVIALFLSF